MSEKLQIAQLIKLQKELDAREAFIDEKQKILEEAPITFEIYKGQVAAKELQLAELNVSIKEAEETKERLTVETTSELSVLEKKKGIIEADIETLNNNVADKKSSLIEFEKKLTKVQNDIKARNDYLLQLEQEIEEKNTEGNAILLETDDKVNQRRSELALLDIDIVARKKERDEVGSELQTLKNELTREKEGVAVQKNKMNNTLELLHDEIIKKSKEMRAFTDDYNDKMQQLKEKEESLIAKINAFKLEKHEFETARRRFNSERVLYDL